VTVEPDAVGGAPKLLDTVAVNVTCAGTVLVATPVLGSMALEATITGAGAKLPTTKLI
jgi:hypothetical protein